MTDQQRQIANSQLKDMRIRVERLMVISFGERASDMRDLWRVQFLGDAEEIAPYRVEIGDTYGECPQYPGHTPDAAVEFFKAAGLMLFRARMRILDKKENKS